MSIEVCMCILIYVSILKLYVMFLHDLAQKGFRQKCQVLDIIYQIISSSELRQAKAS